MEPKGSSPHSQEPVTCTEPEPDRSSLCPPQYNLSKILRLRMEERPSDMEGSSRGPTRGGPPAWGLGEVLTTPQRKKLSILRNVQRSRGIWSSVEGNRLWDKMAPKLAKLWCIYRNIRCTKSSGWITRTLLGRQYNMPFCWNVIRFKLH